MSARIEATTPCTPMPPSGAPGPWPPSATASHTKNQITFPSPLRSGGVASNSSAAAAVTATRGSAISAKGSSSGPGSMVSLSPRASCITGAVSASTPAMEPSTITLLRNFAAR
ncbi:hypothetical protein [Streptomyces milbemycinicus]|uniref:Uncharacterized protein n=1 Tax=Streptomyces milbemycinicus TaxID=476552 RepID=A0ABW8LDI0_9ACTN